VAFAEFPEIVTLAGLIEPQDNPEAIESVSETVPENPPRAVIVIVEVCDCPTLLGGVTDWVILKSGP
jgi:hypothetical protein